MRIARIFDHLRLYVSNYQKAVINFQLFLNYLLVVCRQY